MKKINDTEAIDAYMKKLKHPLKAEMEAVRQIIMQANDKIAERIKWNAPSFYYKEDIAAFHPRATSFVHLVMLFPKGMPDDESKLLEGDYTSRRMVYFKNMDDVKSKKAALTKIINEWIKLMDK